jgi:hypothetical protein
MNQPTASFVQPPESAERVRSGVQRKSQSASCATDDPSVDQTDERRLLARLTQHKQSDTNETRPNDQQIRSCRGGIATVCTTALTFMTTESFHTGVGILCGAIMDKKRQHLTC